MYEDPPSIEEPVDVGHYFTTPYLATRDLDHTLPCDILMLMLDRANKPPFPTEIVLIIAGYLDPVDLACFRAVNLRLRRTIGYDTRGVGVRCEPNGDRIMLHSTLKSRAEARRKAPYPQVHVRPGLYDRCTEWAIMCRFERDMNLSRAENLVCFGCHSKHPRRSFIDFKTKLENFLPSHTPETRLCLNRRDLLFEWADYEASKRETLRHVKGLMRSPGTRKCHIVIEHIDFCIHCRDEVVEGKCLCDEFLFGENQSLEKQIFRCKYCPRMVEMPRYWFVPARPWNVFRWTPLGSTVRFYPATEDVPSKKSFGRWLDALNPRKLQVIWHDSNGSIIDVPIGGWEAVLEGKQ